MVHKYDMSSIKGRGGRDKMVSIKEALVNKHGPTINREGMDMFSMVVLLVGGT